MVHTLLPSWFLGYGTFLELLFFVITALVAFYAWKVYSITGKESAKGMFGAFALFSGAYLALLVTSIYSILGTGYVMPEAVCSVSESFRHPMFLVYMVLYLAGLVRLGTAIFNIPNKLLYYLVTTIMSVALIMSSDTELLFNIVSAVILLFIGYHTLMKYYKRKNIIILYFYILIIFLLLGRIHYFITSHDDAICVVDHTVTFIAHAVLFVVVFLVMQHGFKKR